MPISDFAHRLNGWPRRILAVCCLLLAGAAALGARHSGDPPRTGHPVLVAARDLPAGTRLSSADVRLRSWPDELRPAGAFSSGTNVAGRSLAGAVRAGEAVTETRLSGPGLAAGLPPTLRADRDLDWTPWPTGGALGVDAIAAVDLVLAPALAVSEGGVRLGRGGGSYDRALARVPSGVPIWALIYDDELVDELPRDDWDVPVTGAITPSGWHDLRP